MPAGKQKSRRAGPREGQADVLYPKMVRFNLKGEILAKHFLGSKSFIGKKWRPTSPDEALYSGHNGRKSEWVMRGAKLTVFNLSI